MFPKFRYIRSKRILEACRAMACQHCGAQDGTVIAAHSNQARHGKGRSIKASDQFVAALCFRCHHEVDQGKADKATRLAIWEAAHERTKAILEREELWPL